MNTCIESNCLASTSETQDKRFHSAYSDRGEVKPPRGFTLIELLVVIAIIGLLASVVLASLNTARRKGADTAVKANLNSMRVQAAIYYDSHGSSYGTFAAATCPQGSSGTAGMMGDDAVWPAVAAAKKAAGSLGATYCAATPGGAGSYAIAVTLQTTGEFWCVDSRGTSKKYTGAIVDDAITVVGSSVTCTP